MIPMYSINFTTKARKQVRRLSEDIKKKLRKKLKILITDFHNPTLHTKKKEGGNQWESRVDYHYRFSFEIHDHVIMITAIGMHDEGLGKK